MTDSDEALAKRAKMGDRQAFEVLVRRHKNSLYSFCRRYIGDADDALDVLQDAFVAAWLGLSRYDERRSFAVWLRTISLNKCRDFSRRRAVRRLFLARFEREQAGKPIPFPGDAAADPDSERLDRLEQEIAALAPVYKEALLLTTLSGLSHREAARELGVSAKAIEMRVYRAKQKLAARMEDQSVLPP